MKTPKNQHQEVIYYLLKWRNGFSLKDVINDSMFIKFNSRLSDIELEFGRITEHPRKRVKFTNQFGRKSDYCIYKLNDEERAIEIYDKV